MNKSELVSSVAEKAGVSKAQAGAVVDAFMASITETLASGGDVRLPGFGSFEVSHRAATKGRNPSTGAEIDIPARSVPKFSAGKSLKEAVNKK
ncbi:MULTISPECIES: HU family DNA-binding protein [unclassified Bartonella]|uniref:HU family DNA-binding protein n=1 Tax=unclassified Bartonella TaxID=2645622 RepID=UPI0023609C74|nr:MULTISPECIES: HU family DNA-binding protein [unclassified Bartonella]